MTPQPHKKPQRAIVGAGRIGRALGRALHQKGWPIGAVVSRSPATARAAAKAIGAGQPHAGLDKHILDADVILITTPDAAISAVAAALAQRSSQPDSLGKGSQNQNKSRTKLSLRGKTFLHTCGALDAEVLRPLELRGAATGVVHPLQTFSGKAQPQLQGSACAIEGSAAALKIARKICKELGAIPIRIPRNKKAAYHAAAVLAAGHILTNMEAATQILMTLGLSRQKAVSALLPLTRQTLSNFERDGGPKSWTGPAARGDMETVQRHLSALSKFPKRYKEAYAALTNLGILLLSHPK